MRTTFIFLLASSRLFSVDYVTSFLNGQLGNQLFQIAAAVSFALDHGCEARFPDIEQALGGEINARYILHRLNKTPFPEEVEFQSYYDQIHSNIYAPIPFQQGQNLRIYGHFESNLYFIKYGKEIRALFEPTPEILLEIQEKYGELLKDCTVAVHVRTFLPDRRDPSKLGIGGSGWRYFINAMDYFPPNTHFVVFSDAMEWTKSRFPKRGRKVTFIEGNPHHIDFYLMSLCTHQIVSPESTFSWWAAWLNPNPNKIVIAANVWNHRAENDTIPPGWIKMEKTLDPIGRN